MSALGTKTFSNLCIRVTSSQWRVHVTILAAYAVGISISYGTINNEMLSLCSIHSKTQTCLTNFSSVTLKVTAHRKGNSPSLIELYPITNQSFVSQFVHYVIWSCILWIKKCPPIFLGWSNIQNTPTVSHVTNHNSTTSWQ